MEGVYWCPLGMVNSAELALKAQYSIIDHFICKISKITKVLHPISHNLNYSDLLLTILLFYSIFDIPFLKVTFLFILYEVDILSESLIEPGSSETLAAEDTSLALHARERARDSCSK